MKRVSLLMMSLLAATIPVPATSAAAYRPDPQTAKHRLGFSGATISIREEYPPGWPIANRTFSLTGANGVRRSLPLHPGGGTAGNQSLNLFVTEGTDGDHYLLTSERDCIEFDPVRVTAKGCLKRPPCANNHLSGATYLGRFDWMNGIDPPKGEFRLAFRFLGPEDALESGSCAATPPS
jgi:hypothetical protein